MKNQKQADNRICLTFDIDWAHEAIISTVIKMLDKAGAKGTFFATHQSRLLSNLNSEQFEIGLHPNFNDFRADFEDILQGLKKIYPGARGVRSHSLLESSLILQLFQRAGLKYEVNTLLPFHEGLHPVIKSKGLLSIPFYWEDDTHFILEYPFELDTLRLETPGLKVLSFHPIHIFMNTCSESHYQSYKIHSRNPGKLEGFINRQSRGIGKLFEDLMDYISARRKTTSTLGEIYEEYMCERENLD